MTREASVILANERVINLFNQSPDNSRFINTKFNYRSHQPGSPKCLPYSNLKIFINYHEMSQNMRLCVAGEEKYIVE